MYINNQLKSIFFVISYYKLKGYYISIFLKLFLFALFSLFLGAKHF